MSGAGLRDIYRTAGSGHQLILCHIVAFFVAIRPRHYWQIVKAVQRLEKPGLGGSLRAKEGLSHRAEGVKLQRHSVQWCAGLVVQIRPTAQWSNCMPQPEWEAANGRHNEGKFHHTLVV